MALGASDEELEQGAAQILEQTRRITRIVESLVTFSHSGQLPQHHHLPVDIHDSAAEAIALLGMDPDRRQQRFINDCGIGLKVSGDPQRLLQVFVNLFANAADASPDDAPVRISAVAEGDFVDVTIEDHGHGIPAALLDTLFEPFVTSKPPGRGTGLGLALVYSIIEDHSGSIRVESPIEGDHGTRFIIRLPAVNTDTASNGISA
jgi:signal transduction histidine kinase